MVFHGQAQQLKESPGLKSAPSFMKRGRLDSSTRPRVLALWRQRPRSFYDQPQEQITGSFMIFPYSSKEEVFQMRPMCH